MPIHFFAVSFYQSVGLLAQEAFMLITPPHKNKLICTFMASTLFMLQGCVSEPTPGEVNQNTNRSNSSINPTAISSVAVTDVSSNSSSVNNATSSSVPVRQPVSSSSYAPPEQPEPKTTAIPGRIQAQDYMAANDDDTRSGDATGLCGSGNVDMRTTTDNNGGCKIGWTLAGEWVDYVFTSNSDGQFDIISQTKEVPGDAWTDYLKESKVLVSDWKSLGCGMYNQDTKTCIQIKSNY